MSELHWTILVLSIITLTALMIWGLRRPEVRERQQPVHGHDTAQLAEEAESEVLAEDLLSATLIEDWRTLRAFFGPDTPDLIVSFWSEASRDQAPLSSYQQRLLPVGEGIHETLAALEAAVTVRQEDPSGTGRLLAALAFIHAPEASADLIIQSHAATDRFRHRFHLMDAEGRIRRLHFESDATVDGLIGEKAVQYRRAVVGVLEGSEGGSGEFRRRIDDEFRDPCAHLWLGIAGRREGADLAVVRRHLSIASELHEGTMLTRIASAAVSGPSALQVVMNELRDEIAASSDQIGRTGFLVAQSLYFLDQSRAASLLCETMLADHPDHPGALKLLKMIERRERGAQT